MQHFIVDGYNLLFRIAVDPEDFQAEREKIIYDLNEKIQLVGFDVSIVFDAHYCVGIARRTHFNHLEILFSGEGETADDLILKVIKNSPKHYTVVTCDNKLAWRSRRVGAKTESIETFYKRFDKKVARKIPCKPVEKKAKTTSKKVTKPPKNASVQQCFDYYLYLFEKKSKDASN